MYRIYEVVEYGLINPSQPLFCSVSPGGFEHAYPIISVAFTAHYNGPRYFSELGDLDQFYCVILLVLVSCGPNATVNFWTRKMSGLLSLVLVSTVFFQTMLISHPSSGRFLVTFAHWAQA